MQDRPTTMELLEAAREFLEREVLPTLTAHGLRYRTLIALNLLRLVEREIPGREARLSAELAALHDLLDRPAVAPPADAALLEARVREASRELCERIRAGAADAGPWRARVLAYVDGMIEAKLAINDPQRLVVFTAGRRRGPSRGTDG